MPKMNLILNSKINNLVNNSSSLLNKKNIKSIFFLKCEDSVSHVLFTSLAIYECKRHITLHVFILSTADLKSIRSSLVSFQKQCVLLQSAIRHLLLKRALYLTKTITVLFSWPKLSDPVISTTNYPVFLSHW